MENLINEIIAGCRIEKLLGQGGMGSVYKAWHLNLDIPIALKLLDARVGVNQDLVDRFLIEARSAARLDSPHIVRVMQVGEDKGFYFIQMELVEGESLRHKITREAPLQPPLAINYLYQIALGLDVAHQQNVIHRDIKPDNILIHPKGILKIADFGLAKLLQDKARLTGSGQILGTPYYLAPEQCEGKPSDAKSDIYSLGVTFFYMITGKLPFTGENPLAIAISRLYSAAPSPLKIKADLPPELAKITEKMMALAPEDRYQTIRALLRDIAPLLPTSLRLPPSFEDDTSTKDPLVQALNTQEILSYDKTVLQSPNFLSFSRRDWSSKKIVLISLAILGFFTLFLYVFWAKDSAPPSLQNSSKKENPTTEENVLSLSEQKPEKTKATPQPVEIKATPQPVPKDPTPQSLETKEEKRPHPPQKIPHPPDERVHFFNDNGHTGHTTSGQWVVVEGQLCGAAPMLPRASISWTVPHRRFLFTMEFHLLPKLRNRRQPGSMDVIFYYKEAEYHVTVHLSREAQTLEMEGNAQGIKVLTPSSLEVTRVESEKKLPKQARLTLVLRGASIKISKMQWSEK